MLIGILECGPAPDALRPQYGEYPDFFERLLADRGLEFRRYSVMEMEFPGDVHECGGWLITGSKFGAYEDHPFIRPLEEFIRRAYAEDVPVVGICFGHQIMAQAMGGKVEKYAGGWTAGTTDYDFGGEKVTLNAWHQDQVTRKPEAAALAGSNPTCAIAALRYGDRMYSVQAHPEFTQDFMAGLMEVRGKGVVPDEVLRKARARLSEPLDSARIADRIAAFFHDHKHRAEAVSA